MQARRSRFPGGSSLHLGALATALLSGSPPAGLAQDTFPARIPGTVVDQDDGRPVAGAELRIRGTELRGTSDEQGRFLFRMVPPGPRVLEVSHLSCRVRNDSLFVSIPGAPLRFSTDCGAIVIWTHVPEKGRKGAFRLSEGSCRSATSDQLTTGEER